MNRWKCMAALAMAAVVTAAGAARAEDEAVRTARKLMKEHANAVIHIQGVAKMSASGGGRSLGEREGKFEALGTLIGKDGLVVTAYSALDPSSTVQGRMMNVGGQQVRIQVKTEFSEIRLRFADGTETPARVVLKDLDLDLAFVVAEPTEDEPLPDEFPHVQLKQGAKAEVLDPVVRLLRLGKSLDRRPAVRLDRIGAVVKKPRTFYVIGQDSLGAPIFTADGKLLGLNVRRKAPGEGGSPAVVLPVRDVAEIADQARSQIDKDSAEATDEAKETDEAVEDEAEEADEAAEEVEEAVE